MSSYVIKHTVPVWVYVEDGKITRVVGDDEKLSEPLAIVHGPTADEGAWTDADERPLTPEEQARYDEAHQATPAWPAWDWGF
jgi:hypothetical protein